MMMIHPRSRLRLWTFAGCAALATSPAAASAEDGAADANANDAASAGVCKTDIRLGGTVYQHRNPERSMAMLRSPRSPRAGVYVRGMGIDAYRIVTVEPRGVLLRDDDEYCWLRLKPDAVQRRPKLTPPGARPKRSGSRASAAFSAQELDRGVKKVGDTQYQLDQRLLERAFSRIAQLARVTSFRTVQRDGRPYGMRLRKLAKDGLLARAGLRRGDVVRTLNGISLASPDGALRARTQLSEAKQLSLAIVRNGKPITIEYGIR